MASRSTRNGLHVSTGSLGSHPDAKKPLPPTPVQSSDESTHGSSSPIVSPPSVPPKRRSRRSLRLTAMAVMGAQVIQRIRKALPQTPTTSENDSDLSFRNQYSPCADTPSGSPSQSFNRIGSPDLLVFTPTKPMTDLLFFSSDSTSSSAITPSFTSLAAPPSLIMSHRPTVDPFELPSPTTDSPTLLTVKNPLAGGHSGHSSVSGVPLLIKPPPSPEFDIKRNSPDFSERTAAVDTIRGTVGTPTHRSKRDNIVQEILSTEETYVKCLRTLDELYVRPLRALAATSVPLIPTQKIDAIFMNVDHLLRVNEMLLGDLQARIENWSDTQKIGDVFSKLAPMFKMYTAYTDRFDDSLACLTECEKKEEFVDFLRRQQSLPECRGRDVRSLLIMPVQRIPRYNLLLQDLLHSTPETHPDFFDIERALIGTRMVATHVNNSIRKRENRQRIQAFADRLVNGKTLFKEQIWSDNFPSREFLKEGKLMKICRKAPKERSFFLFNDCLVYCVEITSTLLQFHRCIPLLNCDVSMVPDTDVVKNAFVVTNSHKSFKVYAMDETDRFNWVSGLRAAIDDMVKKLRARIPDSPLMFEGTKAPLWVPDDQVKKCHLCQTLFSMFRRKHHCRKCGHCICADCSSRKFLLKHIDTKPVRVCDMCHKDLSFRHSFFHTTRLSGDNEEEEGVDASEGKDQGV